MTSEMMPCPACNGSGKQREDTRPCVACSGSGNARYPAPATDLARLAEAWKDAEVALKEIEPLRKANANWRATYEQQQIAASEARTAFLTALSALQAEVREVTRVFAEVEEINTTDEELIRIANDCIGKDYIKIWTRMLHMLATYARQIRKAHRRASALHEKMEG